MQVIKRVVKTHKEQDDVFSTKKETIDTEVISNNHTFQISYNSHGHIVLRAFNPEQDEHSEILVVLTVAESRKLKEFLVRL